MLAALAPAVPVWAALGLLAGSAMVLPSGWTAWTAFVLGHPLGEELLFRGLLQGELLRLTTRDGEPRRAGALTWANLLTTAAFVAFHLPAQPLVWALAVAVPSLVLGHLRERLGAVWPCAVVHAAYNGGFALTAWLARL